MTRSRDRWSARWVQGLQRQLRPPRRRRLLIRLAKALEQAMTDHGGCAYRLGGAEFCVLAAVDPDNTTPIVAAASQALSEHGGGFSITASYGAILLPQESQDVTEAMRLVDQRMYAQKTSARRSPDRQSRDVLLRALQERNSELAERHAAVARLAEAIGQRMGLVDGDRAQLRQAAELHDIGKLAIPEELLHQPGPLDAEEWAFVRRHPLIGERIIGAAPALAGAAKLVGATHERPDGSGYPNGVAGDQIPLGARIIAVCDAFTAMTFPRSYAPQLTVSDAIEEVRRCAGTQFDPTIVDAWPTWSLDWPGHPNGQPLAPASRIGCRTSAEYSRDLPAAHSPGVSTGPGRRPGVDQVGDRPGCLEAGTSGAERLASTDRLAVHDAVL
jgi:two-component system, cell cycle response regulator